MQQRMIIEKRKISLLFNKEKKNIFLFLAETHTAAFELSKEFTSMPWLIEIKAETFMPYRPTTKDKRLNKEYSNRTMIIEVELPSGKRSYFIFKKSCDTKPSNSLLGA